MNTGNKLKIKLEIRLNKDKGYSLEIHTRSQKFLNINKPLLKTLIERDRGSRSYLFKNEFMTEFSLITILNVEVVM